MDRRRLNPPLVNGLWPRRFAYVISAILILLVASRAAQSLSPTNGFDLSDTLVPANEIHHGGPARDGIPSIDKPRFISAREVDYLKPDDRILGLVYQQQARAYPVRILNYHEIVNDRINDQAFVVTYCPLCGSGMAFKPPGSAGEQTFGVSGLLYNSDMLLYDRESESLWSQIMGKAISGDMMGKKLEAVVLHHTSWKDWRSQYPQTSVLSTRTGYWRDYASHPYGDYDVNSALYFPVSNFNKRYHPKERVIGITIGDKAKTYPISELDKAGSEAFTDVFAGKKLTIQYNKLSKSAAIYNGEGRQLPVVNLFWFAWVAFHPHTLVYSSE